MLSYLHAFQQEKRVFSGQRYQRTQHFTKKYTKEIWYTMKFTPISTELPAVPWVTHTSHYSLLKYWKLFGFLAIKIACVKILEYLLGIICYRGVTKMLETSTLVIVLLISSHSNKSKERNNLLRWYFAWKGARIFNKVRRSKHGPCGMKTSLDVL